MQQIPTQQLPRITLRRVLWVRFLRYIEKTKFVTLKKHFLRLSALLFIAFCLAVPQLAKELLYDAVTRYYAPAIRLSLIPLTYLCIKLYKIWSRRTKKITGNDKSFYGVSIDEFATFLIERGAFKYKDVKRRFGFSQEKYTKIGKQLEGYKILVRGDNNARVLNKISREDLVIQLRDGFPLIPGDGKEWVQKRGSFDSFCLESDRRDKRHEEKKERKEKAIKRLDKKIEERKEAVFTTRLLDYA